MDNISKVIYAVAIFVGAFFVTNSMAGISIPLPVPGVHQESSTKMVNINTASLDQLTSINGLSRGDAQSIINYRNANGKFASISDLNKVPGVTSKVVAQITPKVDV